MGLGLEGALGELLREEQSREIKGDQGRSREINPGQSRSINGNPGQSREIAPARGELKSGPSSAIQGDPGRSHLALLRLAHDRSQLLLEPHVLTNPSQV